jgi:hypothetical protein
MRDPKKMNESVVVDAAPILLSTGASKRVNPISDSKVKSRLRLVNADGVAPFGSQPNHPKIAAMMKTI